MVQREDLAAKADEDTLFFETRHSEISENLIKRRFRTQDSLLGKYTRIVKSIQDTRFHEKVLIDLLKAISKTNDLDKGKLDKLYDIVASKFEESSFFNIHYAINLQQRNTFDSIEKAIRILQYVQRDDDLSRPNHFIIHRRGSLCFSLAKLYLKNKNVSMAISSIEDAREFFRQEKNPMIPILLIAM